MPSSDTVELALKPPIKYVGGKMQLLDRLLPLVPSRYGTYYEPFVVGGAMLLALQPEHAVIGDVSYPLVSMWTALRDDADGVMGRLTDIQDEYNALPSDGQKRLYYDLRDRFNGHIGAYADGIRAVPGNGAITIDRIRQTTDVAALMIATNKLCFNGLFRLNRHGRFNTPHNGRRHVTLFDEHNITGIHEYLSGNDVRIMLSGWQGTLSDTTGGDVVFADPPYIPENDTSFVAYAKSGFTMEQQEELAAKLSLMAREGIAVITTNSDTDEVRRLYGDAFDITEVKVHRNVNRNGNARHGMETIMTAKRRDGISTDDASTKAGA